MLSRLKVAQLSVVGASAIAACHATAVDDAGSAGSVSEKASLHAGIRLCADKLIRPRWPGTTGGNDALLIPLGTNESLIRVRLVDAPKFAATQERSSDWTFRVFRADEPQGIDVAMEDPDVAAVLGYRENKDSSSASVMYLQARMTIRDADRLEIKYLPQHQRWNIALHTAAPLTIPFATVHALKGEAHAPCEPEWDLLKETDQAIRDVAQTCAVALKQQASHCANHPRMNTIMESIYTGFEDTIRFFHEYTISDASSGNSDPGDVVTILDAFEKTDPALRLVVSNWGENQALGSLYEVNDAYHDFSSQVLLVKPRPKFTKQNVTLPERIQEDDAREAYIKRNTSDVSRDCGVRFATVNLQSNPFSYEELDAGWSFGPTAVHELFHMLGGSHNINTATTGDDFINNLMGVTRPDGQPTPQNNKATWHLSQRQCLLMGLDLFGYATGADAR